MRRWWWRFGTALRFALIEQARNRLALLMVVLFVPLWTTLAFTVVARTPLRFRIRAVGRTVVMDGNILVQINGALQALSLVIAFMMFVATARSALFDQRLVRAGYPLTRGGGGQCPEARGSGGEVYRVGRARRGQEVYRVAVTARPRRARSAACGKPAPSRTRSTCS